MSGHERDMVRLRLDAARESLEAARDTAAKGQWRNCSNRIYYACFYAVLGVLSLDGKGGSKHSGVRSIFNTDYVNQGLFSEELGKFYSQVMTTRTEVDYELEKPIPVEKLQGWLPIAEQFIDAVEAYVAQRGQADER